MVDKLLHAMHFDMICIFCRYEDLYTWSRWDKALFLSKVNSLFKQLAVFNALFGGVQVPKVGKLCTFALLPSNFRLKYQEPEEDEGDRAVVPIPHVKTKDREQVD